MKGTQEGFLSREINPPQRQISAQGPKFAFSLSKNQRFFDRLKGPGAKFCLGTFGLLNRRLRPGGRRRAGGWVLRGLSGRLRQRRTCSRNGGVLLGRKNRGDFAAGWRTNGLFRGTESRIDAKSANSANFVKTLAILKELRYNNSTRITCGRDRRLVPAYPL